MRTAALAGCVAVAVAVSFAMHDGVPPWTVAVWIPLFIASFLLGRRTANGWTALVLAGAVAGGLMGLTVVGLAVALPWFLGRVAHQQAALAAAGAEAAHLRERTRIAHEVHDTLGHELSLIALQAGALEMTVPAEHQDAAARLRVTAAAATERLADLVLLLREGDPPSVLELRDLVDRAVAAGLRVEFSVDGAVPSTVEPTVLRVVQEALTNAAKHAPKSLLLLKVTSEDATTVVEASNDAGLRRGAGSRLGLVALRERVRLAGGTLRVSRGGGRFELVATLPHAGES
ncbi:sensor histidine kinase [Lentzea aerocolonigenes]|uniref:sensor histidine kinase n=1 Tax=Lentzea aerocolonigenes TaxID=68170 RepID=UPI0004C39EFA|nr:histidine kinase [Lentzea aerocolonigenes]MCP2246061.1 Signal transduction histidine kinase [Lentzea aerocolonigenes]